MITSLEANGHVDGRRPNKKPSVDEWVLGAVHENGTLTLDQIGKLLSQVSWAQLFLAIDRLSRTGQISLWSPRGGDYLITVNRRQPRAA